MYIFGKFYCNLCYFAPRIRFCSFLKNVQGVYWNESLCTLKINFFFVIMYLFPTLCPSCASSRLPCDAHCSWSHSSSHSVAKSYSVYCIFVGCRAIHWILSSASFFVLRFTWHRESDKKSYKEKQEKRVFYVLCFHTYHVKCRKTYCTRKTSRFTFAAQIKFGPSIRPAKQPGLTLSVNLCRVRDMYFASLFHVLHCESNLKHMY